MTCIKINVFNIREEKVTGGTCGSHSEVHTITFLTVSFITKVLLMRSLKSIRTVTVLSGFGLVPNTSLHCETTPNFKIRVYVTELKISYHKGCQCQPPDNIL